MRKHVPLKLLFIICLIASLSIFSGCATTQKAQQASSGEVAGEIADIQVRDNMVEIKSSTQFTFTVYSTDDPYKVAVEIPALSLGKFKERITSDRQGIVEILPLQIESPQLTAKLQITLQNPSAVVPEYKDNVLTLSIKGDTPAAVKEDTRSLDELVAVADAGETAAAKSLEEEKPASQAPETTQQPMSKATVISGIEMKKFPDSVKVMISGNGTMIPNVFPLDERIVVDIPQVALEAKVPSETISPVRGIRAGKHKDKVRLVIDLKEKSNYDVTAVGSSVVISLQKSEAAPVQTAMARTAADEPMKVTMAPMPPPVFEGQQASPEMLNDDKRISLDFQDADIIPIFRLLADISGYNIVVSPEIKGKITLKLNNVPWTQALDLILRTFSLSKIVDGNVIRVVPTAAVTKEHEELAKVKKAQSESGDLKTRIFPVNYADLGKLKDAIDKAKILSSRGNIVLDERGSTIIANDLEPNLEKIAILVAEVDKESMQARQVMIEAKIVEINSDYTRDLGVQWGANFVKPSGSGTTIIGATAAGGPGLTGNNFLVNLPAAAGPGAGGAIGIGYISKAANLNLDLQLSAMEQIKKGKVISSPRIMTMNNEKAKINQGRTLQVPITTADKVDLKEVPILLSLDVTPRIAPGGAILMTLKITKDELIGVINVGDASGVDMTKNSVDTTVLVNSGDTVVIGGIFKQSSSNQNDGVPGLARIPILGWLFKKHNEIENSNELIVFITPKVVEFSSLK